MLHIVFPRANVLVAISEYHSPLAALEALLEITGVLPTVLVGKLAFAFKGSFIQVPLVGLLLLSEVVNAIPVEETVRKITLEVGAVRPLIATAAMHLSVHKLATKLDLPEFPRLFAKTLLKIVDPLALGGASLRVDETAVAVSHVVLPVALVDVAIGLRHAAPPAHFIVYELTNVRSSIFPSEHAYSVTHELAINHSPEFE